jgi:hypothetical protein
VRRADRRAAEHPCRELLARPSITGARPSPADTALAAVRCSIVTVVPFSSLAIGCVARPHPGLRRVCLGLRCGDCLGARRGRHSLPCGRFCRPHTSSMTLPLGGFVGVASQHPPLSLRSGLRHRGDGPALVGGGGRPARDKRTARSQAVLGGYDTPWRGLTRPEVRLTVCLVWGS